MNVVFLFFLFSLLTWVNAGVLVLDVDYLTLTVWFTEAIAS